jgi:hypothetical protein
MAVNLLDRITTPRLPVIRARTVRMRLALLGKDPGPY